jgi:hypothetical protein
VKASEERGKRKGERGKRKEERGKRKGERSVSAWWLFFEFSFELFESLEFCFDALSVAVLALGVVFEFVGFALLGASTA